MSPQQYVPMRVLAFGAPAVDPLSKRFHWLDYGKFCPGPPGSNIIEQMIPIRNNLISFFLAHPLPGLENIKNDRFRMCST